MDVIAAVVVVTMIVSNGVTSGNAVIYPGLGLRKNKYEMKKNVKQQLRGFVWL